jgi:hypothetical protein
MRHMIYPMPAVPVPQPPAPLREVALSTSRGDRAIVWHAPGPEGAPLVLFFHGNGENLETMRGAGLFEDAARLRAPVAALDYPGYGRSSGQPSEAANLAAAEAALDWALGEAPGRPVVVCGWSLGAAVALELAARRPAEIAGVIALSPWTSLSEVARVHFPGWLVRLALGERYDTLAAGERVRAPALVIHGAEDDLIPAAHGERVAERLRARLLVVPGAGHNDLLARPEVWREMADFIAALSSMSPGPPAAPRG